MIFIPFLLRATISAICLFVRFSSLAVLEVVSFKKLHYFPTGVLARETLVSFCKNN